jgi:hypothetical protein
LCVGQYSYQGGIDAGQADLCMNILDKNKNITTRTCWLEKLSKNTVSLMVEGV